MGQIRQAAVAGTFYPGNPEELAATIDAMLAQASTDQPCPKALIAPHAGYEYSGPIAASIYAMVRNGTKAISRVVLLGPSHRVGFKGIATSNADYFRTPLGDIAIDKQLNTQILALASTGFLDQAHAQEHSLEVQLPFLQRCLGSFSLIPLVVGDATAEEVADVLDCLWGGPETLIVISSDMSHYQPQAIATKLDRETANNIISLNAGISGDQACGCRPINGLLHLARARHLKVDLVDLRNSGDTAGSVDRVVGYAAFTVTEQTAPQLTLGDRQMLLHQARVAIQQGLESRRIDLPGDATLPAKLIEQAASFVTINLQGHLRGCIGSLTAYRSMIDDVMHNAQAAAFHDPRFSPLTTDEFRDIDLHISILSKPEPLLVISREDLLKKIRPGIDGLIIEESGRRATFLPSVWEQLSTPEQFISQLRQKAGLSGSGWSSMTQVERYTTEEFS